MNTEHLPYAKLTKHFDDDVEFNEKMNTMYTNTLQSMEHNFNKTLTIKCITDIEKHNQNVDKLDFLSQYIKIQEDLSVTTLCDYCEKPIGLSGFQYDPVKETIVHSYHLDKTEQTD